MATKALSWSHLGLAGRLLWAALAFLLFIFSLGGLLVSYSCDLLATAFRPARVETVDQARTFLAGHTYEWRDESGNDSGVPTLVWRVSFNDDASQCNVISRPVTQDGWTRDDWEENAMAVQRYINSGNAYVSVDCKATGYDMHIEDGALVVSASNDASIWLAKPL